MIRHLAGPVVDRAQRCDWCDVVLVEWIEETDPRHPRELFFRPGSELLDDCVGTITTAPEASNVPRCIPEVEGVDIR